MSRIIEFTLQSKGGVGSYNLKSEFYSTLIGIPTFRLK